jgi:hypothetical protein
MFMTDAQRLDFQDCIPHYLGRCASTSWSTRDSAYVAFVPRPGAARGRPGAGGREVRYACGPGRGITEESGLDTVTK